MRPHPIAVASDVDNVTVVQKAIDQRRGHDLVPKNAPPVLEALVRCQYGRGALVAELTEAPLNHSLQNCAIRSVDPQDPTVVVLQAD